MKLRHAQHTADGPGLAPARPVVSPQWHAQMAARARVLAQTDASRWQTWLTDAGRASAAPTDVAQAVGTRYGAALSALQLRQPLQAWQQVQLLLALPGLDETARRSAQRLALEIWLAPGAAQVATQPAAPPLVAQLPVWATEALGSAERTGVLLGARAMVQQGQPSAASQRLQLWLSEHPDRKSVV